MDLKNVNEIKLFDADTLEYAGSIMLKNPNQWEFHGVENTNMIDLTRDMPLKGLLASLISFNLVYEVVGCYLD